MTGTLASAADALDQALAAARNDHIHKLGHGNELAHGGAVGGGHQLHRVGQADRLRPGPGAPGGPGPCWRSMASEPPRRMQALPLLMARLALRW